MWRLLGVVAVLNFAFAASASSHLVRVEDWLNIPAETRGIPPAWKSGQKWGRPAYDFVVEQDDTGKVLHVRSRGDSSTMAKEVKVNAKDTPILQWRWKAVTLPQGGDSRNEATDDQALQIYVTFERFPSVVRSRIIGYIWDSTAPEGLVIKSEKSRLVTYVVVRSGTRHLGKWLTESRNVYEDYKRIYGEEPDELVKGVAVAIDSDDTKSSAEGYFGEIFFKKPDGK
jgi:hypothetical protein